VIEPVDVRLPVLACQGGELVVVREERYRIEQSRQIIHIDDFCNECGNCATFCVHHGKPYVEKPRLFLREADYLAEGDNAVFVEGDMIRSLKDGQETRVTIGERIVFEDERVRVELTKDYKVAGSRIKTPFEGELSFMGALDLVTILHGGAFLHYQRGDITPG
jgi:putative selenate reductase